MFIMEPFLPMSLGTLVGVMFIRIPPLNLPSPLPLRPSFTFFTSSTSTTLKNRTSPTSNVLLNSLFSFPKTSEAGKNPEYGEFISRFHMENLISVILPMTTSPLFGMYLLCKGITLIFLSLIATRPTREDNMLFFSLKVPLPV